MKVSRKIIPALLTILAVGSGLAQSPASTLAAPNSAEALPSAEGFIRRWLVLEPIPTNGLTDIAVQAAVKKDYFPNQFTVIPRDADKVTVGGSELTWHAEDTKLYNLNLYHFAHALGKPTTNVLFWAVTIVSTQEEMRDVRLAIGSNSASVWWVNGQEVISIYGDRQTVIDDGVSKRLTLKKGANVIRAAIVNGGGATDFCARFLDPEDRPVKALTVRLSDSTMAQAGPPRRAPIEQQLTFAADHGSGIYETGETVDWTVTPAVEPYSPAGSACTGGNTGRNNGLYAVGAAVAPGKIEVSSPRPADFDAFWDGKLAQQAKIPLNPVLTPVENDVPGAELNMFVLDALGSKAHGYVAKPARAGKFPALIQLQYAGVYALNTRGAAQHAAAGWLFLNVDSHDKLLSDPSGGIARNYQAVGNTDRSKSYFLNMYLRDSRVLDYLLTRRDWYGKTIVPTGGSMGGQQSLILAGLRADKVTAALVCVPAGLM